MTFHSLERTCGLASEYDCPDRYRDLFAAVDSSASIPRGEGVNYVAASFGPGVRSVSLTRFDRILAFCPEERWIEVEAGISLRQLYAFLTPRGFYLSVQPGWPGIRLGSLIATDVHGKNPYRDGTFSGLVQSIRLYHPDKGLLSCSPSENTEVFDLTCGGLGLTGVVVSARIRVDDLKGNVVRKTLIPTGSMHDAAVILEEACAQHDVLMSWTDLSNPSKLGRGFVIVGDIQDEWVERPVPRYKELDPTRTPRFSVFGPRSTPWINRAYYLKERWQNADAKVPLYDALFPFHNKGFYFGLYGRRGFVCNQILVPTCAVEDFLRDLEVFLRRFSLRPVLAALKLFKGTNEYLRFDGEGCSLYFDVPNTEARRDALQAFDAFATDYGCISNVTRNGYLSADVVRRQYLEYERFRDGIRSYDPRRRFASELSQRLAI